MRHRNFTRASASLVQFLWRLVAGRRGVNAKLGRRRNYAAGAGSVGAAAYLIRGMPSNVNEALLFFPSSCHSRMD